MHILKTKLLVCLVAFYSTVSVGFGTEGGPVLGVLVSSNYRRVARWKLYIPVPDEINGKSIPRRMERVFGTTYVDRTGQEIYLVSTPRLGLDDAGEESNVLNAVNSYYVAKKMSNAKMKIFRVWTRKLGAFALVGSSQATDPFAKGGHIKYVILQRRTCT